MKNAFLLIVTFSIIFLIILNVRKSQIINEIHSETSIKVEQEKEKQRLLQQNILKLLGS